MNSLSARKNMHMTLEIQFLAWDRHKNVAGLNRLIGFQPSSLDNFISNRNTYINKQELHRSDPLKKCTINVNYQRIDFCHTILKYRS